MLVGEKSSLRDDLVAIANKYEADWYLPDGEISDTHIELMARSGVLDPRPLALIYFADSDPSGHQMIVSVTRKLQAFAHLAGYEGLQFITHRALLDARPGPVLRPAASAAQPEGAAGQPLARGV